MGEDFMKNKSVKHSLMIMFLFIILILITIISEVAIYSIRSMSALASDNYESAIEDGYKTQIKAEVQSVITVLQAKYEKSQSGLLTEDEAKKEALELVRKMRYGDDEKGYFWIDDTQYNLVMHPILPEQEGTNRYNLSDEEGVMIVQEIMKSVNSENGAGYNEFYFTKEDGVTVAPKIAYSQIFKPWNWIVSTGNYTDDLQMAIDSTRTKINEKSRIMLISIIGIGIIMAICAVLISIFFGNFICKPLVEIQNFADRISEGDLTTDIEVEDKNEIGQTARSLNIAQHKIVELLSNIRDTSNVLEIVIEEFSKNFNDMNELIQKVSISVEDITINNKEQENSTACKSEKMKDTIYESRRSLLERELLNRNSQIMKDYSRKSIDILNELIDENKKTKYDINLIYNHIKYANESVKKISWAAQFISEKTSQTNLLLLKDTDCDRYEFAAIAKEIIKLANESSKAAEEINGVIVDLIKSSDISAETVRKMSEASENEVGILDNTKNIFNELKNAVEKSSEVMRLLLDDMISLSQGMRKFKF